MIKTAILLLAIKLTAAATLVSEPYSVDPELIDTVETEGYKRIWGSPKGHSSCSRNRALRFVNIPALIFAISVSRAHKS